MLFTRAICCRPCFILVLALTLSCFSARGGAGRAAAREGAPPEAQAKSPGAAQAKLVPLPGHVLKILARAKEIAPAADAESRPTIVTLMLHHTDEKAFAQLAEDVNNPTSSSYRHFLSQQQIAERFGPTQQAYDAVRSYLTAHSLSVIQDSTNRLTLTARGTRAQVESAFGVHIRDFQVGTRTFRANIDEPSLPEAIAGYVQSVAGLSTIERPQPLGLQEPDPNPMALATAYDFSGVLLPDGQTVAIGTGQVVGLMEFSGFQTTDVQNWLNDIATPAGLTPMPSTSQVTAVSVGAGPDPLAGQSEAMLDIETVLGAAPGATIRVYEAPAADNAEYQSWVSILQQMIQDPITPTVISISAFVGCEQDMEANGQQAGLSAMDTELMTVAMAGISVFSGSGDHGGTCTALDQTTRTDVAVPADSPHDTAVGGTTLSVLPGNLYGSETLWADNSGDGGGFGVSNAFPLPPWQSAFVPPGTTGRSVPDVSASASPGIFICEQIILEGTGGCPVPASEFPPEGRDMGTSLSTPLWAAGIARINQACGGPSGLVAEWVSIGDQPGLQAFHLAWQMQGPNNDYLHLGLGSFDLGKLAAIRCAASYQFSPNPIAPTGTLATGTTVPVTLTVLNFTGQPVPNAPVYMQFVPTIGGGSVNIPMQDTLQTANAQGQISFNYTAPTPAPEGGGTDEVLAYNSFGQPPFTFFSAGFAAGSDTYAFPTLAELCFVEGSNCSYQQTIFTGTAAQESGLGATVPVTLEARDATGNPVAGAEVTLAFTPYPSLTGGAITAPNPLGSSGPLTLSAGSAPFLTDRNGNIQMTFTVPTGSAGLETIGASATVPQGLYSIPLSAYDTFLVYIPNVPVLTASETRCGSSYVQAIVYGLNGQPLSGTSVVFTATGGTFSGAPPSSPDQITGVTDQNGVATALVNAGQGSGFGSVTVTAALKSMPTATASITATVSPAAASVCRLQSEVLGHINIGALLAGESAVLLRWHGPVPSCNIPGCPDPAPILVWNYQDAVDPWLRTINLTVETQAQGEVDALAGGIRVEILSKSECTGLLRERHAAQLVANLPSNVRRLEFVGAVARVAATPRANELLGEAMIRAGGSATKITLPLELVGSSALSRVKIVRLDTETKTWTDAGVQMTHVDAHTASAIVPGAGTYATILGIAAGR
jgi:kumamolisin